ncbi:hypothetical protein D3C81_1906140 [compost metagenome]
MLQRNTHLRFVAVALGTIEMAETGCQRVLHRFSRDGEITEQGPESNRRHLDRPMVERESGLAQSVVKGFIGHVITPGRSRY